MPPQPQLSRLQIAVVFTFILLGVRGKHVSKRSLADVKCYENGRFYRNPDHSEETMWTNEECGKYYLCLDGDVFEFRCSPGLLFDVNRQLCDMQQNVHNCDLTMETWIPKPLLETAECSNETHFGCADSNCIPAEYFCDGSNDCADASDEGWCEVDYDPNAAEPCDENMCRLPNCFCTKRGNEIPGSLVHTQTPQMITLTFNGPVNHENWDIYTKHIFTGDRKNPNGCPIKATFFISHLYTNYRHVQKLWNDRHEIAVNSITHRGPEDWWTKNATIEDWFDEMVGQANIINRFGKVHMEDFRGLRVPYLSVGWNRQFLMMQEFGFVYDATVVAPMADPPFWPYTLDYKMSHNCSGNNQYCPTRSYAGLWEMVINPLSHGNHTCATLEYCPSTLRDDDVYNILMNNFKRHYLKNRAPYGIHLNAMLLRSNDYLTALKVRAQRLYLIGRRVLQAYFRRHRIKIKSKSHRITSKMKFLDELLKLPDVYFVTYKEVIDWIKRPTPVIQLKKFQPWQCKDWFFDEAETACTQPNTCKLTSKVLEQDKYMITCMECPKSYPWIRNEFGFE